MNLLHIDVEGGWGGSSISLFEIVKKLKGTTHKSYVVCRRQGPIQKKYKKESIEFYLEKRLYSYIPRKKGKNFKNFLGSFFQLFLFPLGILNLIKIINKNKIDIIHLNYEGFFLLGFFLKFFTKKPIIFHVRTQFPENNFICKLIVKLIDKYIADYIFFITHKEKFFFNKYLKKPNVPSKVLFNISSFKSSHKIKNSNVISYFGNISYEKGVDRVLELARLCSERKLKYKFKIFGKINKKGYGSNFHFYLKKQIKKYKLSNITLMGHASRPQNYLSQTYLLIRLSRADDPYGRDVIEALTMGIPSIATGTYQGIIKNNFNGYLIKKFSLKKTLFIFEKLFKNRKIRERLSKNCLKVKYKFDGSSQINDFEKAIKLVRQKI